MTKTETSFVWRPISCWQPAERKQIETAILEQFAFSCLLWLLEISQAALPNMWLPYNVIIRAEFKNRESECKPDTSCVHAQQDEPLHYKYSAWSFQTLWATENCIHSRNTTENSFFFISSLDTIISIQFHFYSPKWLITIPQWALQYIQGKTRVSSWLYTVISTSLSPFYISADRLSGCFHGQFKIYGWSIIPSNNLIKTLVWVHLEQ